MSHSTYKEIQRVTAQISSLGNTGSAVLCKSSETAEWVFVFTARHVVYGEYGSLEDVNIQDVVISKMRSLNSKSYSSYQLSDKDKIYAATDCNEDLAVILVSTSKIEEVTGKLPVIKLIEEAFGVTECMFRGFPAVYRGESPIRLDGQITEPDLVPPHHFEWEVKEDLVAEWIDTEPVTAWQNVAGFSGSGLFIVTEGRFFLLGIVSKFGPFNRFVGEKITRLMSILPDEYFRLMRFEQPEIDGAVLRDIARLLAVTESEVTSRISTSIGGISLERSTVSDTIHNSSEKTKIQALHGIAGVGKSAILKKVLAGSAKSVIALRGEQLDFSSRSLTLNNLSIETSLSRVLSSNYFENGTIIWIDGAEKCIEQGKLQALAELGRLIEAAPNAQLMITLRQHVIEQFRMTFAMAELKVSYTEVPLLTKEELEEIQMKFPSLKASLENDNLYRLLRVPFYLKMAVQLNKAFDGLTPKKFKDRLWANSIDKGNPVRSDTLTNLSVNRAKSMALYASAENNEAIAGLINDQIIVREKNSSNRFAPAHDIFDDWALVRYVRSIYLQISDPVSFIDAIGATYAFRRGFRFWLLEEIEDDPQRVLRFARSLLFRRKEVRSYWVDETLTVLTQSNVADQFLEDVRDELLAQEAELLLQLLNLFRTACKVPNPNLSADFASYRMYSTSFIPSGTGWGSILSFLSTHHASVPYYVPVLKFLSDWSQKVEFGRPLPPEAKAGAKVALWLLDKMGGRESIQGLYNSSEENIKKITRVLFQLTRVIPAEAEKLLEDVLVNVQARIDGGARMTTKTEVVWNQMTSYFWTYNVANQFPTQMLRACSLKWIDTKEKAKIENSFGIPSMDSDYRRYGLSTRAEHDGFPSSTYQTPVLRLLNRHPILTLKWIVKLLHHVTTEFNPDQEGRRSEKVVEVNIQLPFGETITKKGSEYLFAAYRNSNTRVPNVLQSIMMALETYLLNTAKAGHQQTLVYATGFLLRESPSLATTGVICSVVTAYPEYLKEYTFTLLGVDKLVQLDFDRKVAEVGIILPFVIYGNSQHFRDEREKSKNLPHRKKGLDDLITDIIIGDDLDSRQKMYAILDQFKANVDADDMMWRLRVASMDLRDSTLGEPIEINGRQAIPVLPKLSEDLKAIVKKNEQQQTSESPVNAAFLWTQKILKEEENAEINIESWKIHFRSLSAADQYAASQFSYTPASLALVGIQHFYDELSEEAQMWCKVKIMKAAAIKLKDLERDLSFAVGQSPFDDDPATMGCISLLGTDLTNHDRDLVRELIFKLALNITVDNQVLNKFIFFAQDHLWNHDPEFARALTIGLVEYAKLRYKKPRKVYGEPPSDELEAMKTYQGRVDQLVNSVVRLELTQFKMPASLNDCYHSYIDSAIMFMPSTFNTEQRSVLNQYGDLILNLIVDVCDDLPRWSRNTTDYDRQIRSFAQSFARLILNTPFEEGKEFFDKYLAIVLDPKDFDEAIFDFVKNCLEQVRRQTILFERTSYSELAKYWEWLLSRQQETDKWYFFDVLLLNTSIWRDDLRGFRFYEDYKSLFLKIMRVWPKSTSTVNSIIKMLSGPGRATLIPDTFPLLVEAIKETATTETNETDTEKLLNDVWFRHLTTFRQDPLLMANLIEALDYWTTTGSSLAFLMRESVFR